MATYKYKAISKSHVDVEGIIEASNEYEAVNLIKGSCDVVINISEVRIGKSSAALGKIKEADLAILCSQLSVIVGAGLPILRAVEIISDQTENKKLKDIMVEVSKDVSAGIGLADSFQEKGPNLPITFVETIRSGEESGTLEQSFRRLEEYYDKSAKMKNKVKSAMVYPVFTIIVAILVIVVIMVKAVPVFTESFGELGVELPMPTLILIAISNFFVQYWLAMVAFVALGMVVYKFYEKRRANKLKIEKFKLKIPVFGKLALLKQASQFASTMSTLLAAGLSVVQAVSITGKVMDNEYIGTQVKAVVPLLEEGRRLGVSLHNKTELPRLLVEMTAVGEETGAIEDTLNTISKFYDGEIDIQTSRMVTLIEPVIIFFLASIVLFILLAVYAPMFSLYGSM